MKPLLNNRVLIVLCAVMITITYSCITEPDLENYPSVSFKNEVQPIIAANCTQSGCHGAVEPEEFSLQTYEEISGYVKPGNGRKSSLYRVITGRAEEFMPPSPSYPLSEDQIRTIFVWIEQGAPNN